MTRGLDEGAVDAALDRLKAAGCPAVAVSGAFAVDSPEQERAVSQRARELGFTTEEKSFDDIIRIHIEDELGGNFVA